MSNEHAYNGIDPLAIARGTDNTKHIFAKHESILNAETEVARIKRRWAADRLIIEPTEWRAMCE